MDGLHLNLSIKSDDLDTFIFNLEPSLSTLGAIIPSSSSVELNNGYFVPQLSLNNQTPTSILPPPPPPPIDIPLQSNEVNSVADNRSLGFMDPFAMRDQIGAGYQTHYHPSNYFLNHLMGDNEELPILDYFPNQNQPNEPIVPPCFPTQSLQINNVEQLAPSNLDGLNFPLVNALEQPLMLPYFGSQTMDINVKNSHQLPRVKYTPPFDSTLVSNGTIFESSIVEIMNHDPMGLACFLAGVVRPSPDMSHIYKCEICFIEFPTAQAFGGHMKSHAIKHSKDDEDKGSKEKKAKGDKKRSSSACSLSSPKTKVKKIKGSTKSN